MRHNRLHHVTNILWVSCSFLFIACGSDGSSGTQDAAVVQDATDIPDATSMPDAAVSVPTDFPFATAMSSGNYTLTETAIDSGKYEFGALFEPLTSGKITALGINVPDTATYTVNLWDAATKTVLASADIAATTAVASHLDITPVDVEVGKTYAITVLSNDWFRFAPTSPTQPMYPFEVGDIKVTGYGFVQTNSTPTYPVRFPDTSYSGITDLKFTPN